MNNSLCSLTAGTDNYFRLMLDNNFYYYFRGAGLKNMDMEFVQFIIGTIKDFYPDPLNYILVLEMPWVLNGNPINLKLV